MTTDFGVDVSTFAVLTGLADLDPAFTLITDRRVVAEAIARRWITPRGSLGTDDPNYGFDVRALLNDAITEPKRQLLQAMLAAEARKDARVLAIDVLVTFTEQSGVLRIQAFVETALGPFELVLEVTALSATLLKAA